MTSHTKSNLEAASAILAKLREAGYVAYLAGGCVRDRLLGRPPKDHDIATSARPDEVRALYPNARLVGAKFGVVLVRQSGQEVEVATFRTDGTYSDGRRPDEVIFGDERADAGRRDFTINGMFYDPVADRVIDYVGGQDDLAHGIIRTIGDPDARFAEDHLRMLRAIRLSARLDFPIEATTRLAMTRLRHQLANIAPERIWMELEVILEEPTRARGWALLIETGLREYLASAWPAESALDLLAGKRLSALPHQPMDAGLALSAALPDVSTHRSKEICRSFRLSNHLTDQVAWLTSSLTAAHQAAELELADFKTLRANVDWPLLLELLRADLIARGLDLTAYERALSRAKGISREEAAPPPLVTGDDLLAMGVTANVQLGAIHRAVYRAQLNEEICTKDEGLMLARGLWEKPVN